MYGAVLIYAIYFLIKPVEATILLFVILSGLLYIKHERKLSQKTSLKNCTNISDLVAEYRDKPEMLEYFVANLYELSGYKTTVTRPSASGGIGILAEKHGIKYGIEVKLQSPDHEVGMENLQKLHNACISSTTKRIPVFITTSSFTETAIAYAEQNCIVLVDGSQLEKMIARVNIRLTKKEKALAQ